MVLSPLNKQGQNIAAGIVVSHASKQPPPIPSMQSLKCLGHVGRLAALLPLVQLAA